jgi:hypothetical protein
VITAAEHAVFGVPKPAQACMGGWCARRDHCPHFHAEDRRQPAERLCERGHDGMPATLQHEPTTDTATTGAPA